MLLRIDFLNSEARQLNVHRSFNPPKKNQPRYISGCLSTFWQVEYQNKQSWARPQSICHLGEREINF